jgi:diguanylate cyclase (GGDEF)-like protein
LDNLTPFYDGNAGSGFFNLSQHESPFSDKELHRLLEAFSACLDLQQLVQKYFNELHARVPVNHLSVDTPVGQYHVGIADANEREKSMTTELGEEAPVQVRHFYCNALSIKAQQIIREFNKLLRIPLKNAIAFTKLQQVAMKDPLTSLGNRNMYDETLEKQIRQAHRANENLTLLVLDLDNFKPVNDFHGHIEGDNVLMAFAKALSSSLRLSDYAFRFGGDEFCCLLQASGPLSNEKVIERLLNNVENDETLKKHHVTCSIGSAELNNTDTPETLFMRADTALYQAKKQGKDCVVNA